MPRLTPVIPEVMCKLRQVNATARAPRAARGYWPGLPALLRDVYAQAAKDEYRFLAEHDIERLPYTLWRHGEPELTELHPKLVERYWSELLPAALAGAPLQAVFWLQPLWFAYRQFFDRDSISFRAFAARFRSALQGVPAEPATTWLKADAEFGLLQPEKVGTQACRYFFRVDGTPLTDQFLQCGLEVDFAGSALGHHIGQSAITLSESARRDNVFINRMLHWVNLGEVDVRSMPSWRRVLPEIIIKPWHTLSTPASVADTVYQYFVNEKRFGPVVEELSDTVRVNWKDASPEVIEVMKYWSMGDQMRWFMKIIRDTADEIWEHRERFWMAYHNARLIDRVRLIFGPDAQLAARREKGMAASGLYARLESAPNRSHSVLVVKIGDLILIEGSHNRRLKAFKESENIILADLLFKRKSIDNDYLKINSLHFHDGSSKEAGLPHMQSATKWWQRKARDLIRSATGAHLNDAEI